MPRSSRKKVLILDDDKLFARSLERVLGQKYEVETVAKIAEVLNFSPEEYRKFQD